MISLQSSCNPAQPTNRRDQGWKKVVPELPYQEVVLIGKFRQTQAQKLQPGMRNAGNPKFGKNYNPSHCVRTYKAQKSKKGASSPSLNFCPKSRSQHLLCSAISAKELPLKRACFVVARASFPLSIRVPRVAWWLVRASRSRLGFLGLRGGSCELPALD